MLRLLLAMLLAPAAARAAGPYYFTAVTCGADADRDGSYKVLQNMVKLAGEQNTRLTLIFSPDYALYVSTDQARLGEVRGWKDAGHEIGAWHRGPGPAWDGYSALTPEELAALGVSTTAAGGKADYFAALAPLEALPRTGCLEGRPDGVFTASAPAYGICGLGSGHGGPARAGVNDAVYVDAAGARRLSSARLSNKASVEAAKAAFSAMKDGLYGAAFSCSPADFGAYYVWLGVLRAADPAGDRSRTVFAAAAGGELLERELPPEKQARKEVRRRARPEHVAGPSAPKAVEEAPATDGEQQELPKLRPVQSLFGKVGNNHFTPLEKKAPALCGDGRCDPSERANGDCTADCGPAAVK